MEEGGGHFLTAKKIIIKKHTASSTISVSVSVFGLFVPALGLAPVFGREGGGPAFYS